VEKIAQITRQFLPLAALITLEQLSGGVIHQTYKIGVLENGETANYVLQCMNTATFKNPVHVMKNTILVQDFLIKKGYPLQGSIPLHTADFKTLFVDDQGAHWRFFKFIKDSVSFEKPSGLDQLYEAAKAYGTFATFLKDFDVRQLKITIPDFHNLPSRFQDFKKILKNAPVERKQNAEDEIAKTIQFYDQFQTLNFSNLPLRAVHNDCKLSNVLFDKNTQKCIAVIDLDTLMPGYIVTDFGDMVRTMCNTATEDERDLEKVSFDPESFQFLYKGFLEMTSDWISVSEKDNLLNGAIYIILEQAIRFLADYLNGDQYYMVKYPEHNFVRAKNQLKLLTSLLSEQSFIGGSSID
jgi:hypothetical protein